MKAIGVVTTVVATAVAVCATVLIAQSLPDILRYLKIREM